MNELTLDYQLRHELTMRQLSEFFAMDALKLLEKPTIADIGGKGYEDRLALLDVYPDVYDLADGFDICKQPLPRQYNVILCNNTFEHIIDPYQAAKNISSSLRPEGYLFLTTVWEYPFHAYGDVVDTYRYTHQALEILFSSLEKVRCWYEQETQEHCTRVSLVAKKND